MSDVLDLRQYPVLYVDDERSNLLVFRHNFEDDFEVITAESGEEALAILAERDVAVLLADQRMPGMTGAALAERVRHEHPEVVRMILTAYSDIHAAIDSINRGQVSRYITKPWRREDLAATLRAGIEYHALNQRVRELQLRMMRSERLALLGFVAAGIAHDLKSPVAVLMASLETMRQDLDNLQGHEHFAAEDLGLVSELLETVADCRDQVRQITAFIDTIRLQLRERSSRHEVVDLVRLAESTLKLCKAEIILRARLRVDHADPPPVLGDAAQLGQVLLNLLVNSVQAIEVGKARENQITLRLGSRDGQAEVVVEDTGRGIEPDQQARIFDAFFSTKEEHGGTGMGLAIVREIVQRHQGEIAVESVVGEGTRFTVLLPAAPRQEE